MKIAVLYGGYSPEHQASAENATAIKAALEQCGHTVELVEFSKNCVKKLGLRYERVFIAAQGKHHGDGACQALCEVMGLSYTGTRAAAATVINDKVLCKKLCLHHGIPTGRFVEIDEDCRSVRAQERLRARIEAQIGFPAVAKASTQGGSFGITYLAGPQDMSHVQRVFEYDDEGFVEEFLPGRFVTVGVLDVKSKLVALPPLSAIAPTEKGPLQLFDGTFSVVPAGISAVSEARLQQMALKIYRIFRARGYARIDFMLREPDEAPYFLEINAVPGLRPHSFFTAAAKRYGYDLPALCDIILHEEDFRCAT